MWRYKPLTLQEAQAGVRDIRVLRLEMRNDLADREKRDRQQPLADVCAAFEVAVALFHVAQNTPRRHKVKPKVEIQVTVFQRAARWCAIQQNGTHDVFAHRRRSRT